MAVNRDDGPVADHPVAEKVFGILLAAGGGSRFLSSTHKLQATLGHRTVFEHALAAATASDLAGLIVVTGAVHLTLPGPLVSGVIVIHNHRWSEGQASSLQAGLREASRWGACAVVVGLADQPFVRPTAWTQVAQCPAQIAVATYDGIRGNPVKLHSSVWPLLSAEGDQGARSLIALRPDLVAEVACSGSSADIDTTEDLHQWNS